MISSYSLEEVAARHLPPEWKDPVRWLRTRINRGEIKAKRISRGVYRMTDAHIEEWLTADTIRISVPIETSDSVSAGGVSPIAAGLSRRSQHRLRGEQGKGRAAAT